MAYLGVNTLCLHLSCFICNQQNFFLMTGVALSCVHKRLIFVNQNTHNKQTEIQKTCTNDLAENIKNSTENISELE